MSVQRHDVQNCREVNCYACKLATFNIGAGALPTRKHHVNYKADWCEGFAMDQAAYKRLRAEGLQPKGVVGSTVLERHAVSKWEIETGQNFKGDERVGRKHDELQSAVVKAQAEGKTVEV